MSAGSKARFYGLPSAVVDLALARGVHPDCLRQTSGEFVGHPECTQRVLATISEVYPEGETMERMHALADDVAREQREP